MSQKLIRIGNSKGIIIPDNEVKELGLELGDELNYKLAPVKKSKHDKLMQDYEKFVKKYGQTLKNLADR